MINRSRFLFYRVSLLNTGRHSVSIVGGCGMVIVVKY